MNFVKHSEVTDTLVLSLVIEVQMKNHIEENLPLLPLPSCLFLQICQFARSPRIIMYEKSTDVVFKVGAEQVRNI